MDRWEKIVEKVAEQENQYRGAPFIRKTSAAKLLRQQHQRVVRLVKQRVPTDIIKTGWWDGYRAACQDILNRLNQRR
jgi:hypothetical protein